MLDRGKGVKLINGNLNDYSNKNTHKHTPAGIDLYVHKLTNREPLRCTDKAQAHTHEHYH